MRRLLPLVLLLASALLAPCVSAHHPTNVVSPLTTPKDSRVGWAPFLKQPIPDINVNSGDAFNFNLIDYYAAGDVNVTNTSIAGCTSASPTFTAGGTITPGGVLTQTDKNNATYGGTASGGTANNTYTIKVTNCFDAVGFTDSIDWHVTGAGVTGTVIPEGTNNYFVCNDGNDANAGNTRATRWATVTKVNGAFTSGTTSHAKVWFCSGGVWSNQRMVLDWPGASNDRVVVGTYYVSGGVAYQLMPDNILGNAQDNTQGWSNGARAIISGSYTPSCRVWPTRCLIGPGAVPGGAYDGLIENDGAAYVTLQSLDIRNSAGAGIAVYGYLDPTCNQYPARNAVGCQDFMIIQYNRTDHTNYDGIILSATQYATVRGNDFGYMGLGAIDGYSRLCPTSANCGPDAGPYFVHCDPCHYVIENNWMHDIWAEVGIGDASFILWRGNRFANIERTGPYFDGAADVVAEQNNFAGGRYTWENGLGNPALKPTSPTGGGGAGGPAFYSYALVKEAHGQSGGNIGTAAAASERNIFRNNFAANYQGCLVSGVINDSGDTAFAGGGFWGNTCIGPANRKALSMAFTGSLSLGIAPAGIEVKNNILAVQTGIAGCDVQITTPLIPIDHNFWTGTPADTDCRNPGTGDVYGTYAGLSLASAFAHFGDADETHFPAASDYQIANGSTAASGGADLSANYLDMTKWQWEFDNATWYPSCASGLPTANQWKQKNGIDYCGVVRSFGSRGALNRNP